jgi:hypothetical protein
VEVLHQVFSPYGFVEKIVTFQKSAGQLLQVLSLSLSLSLSLKHEKLAGHILCLGWMGSFIFSFFIFLNDLDCRVLGF